jgi:hypothetical protein
LEVVTPAQARDVYLAQGGFAAASADFLTGFQNYSGMTADSAHVEQPDTRAPGPMPTAEDVTGTPARTFTAWAREHARDFRAPGT